MAMVTIDEGIVDGQKGFGARILAWLEHVGQSSSGAKAARQFTALNKLSDEELAARGLRREDLVELCFGYHRWG
ncbi:MAG: hypothetical protein AAGH68_06205 [Pseudomonadota bacterium]